MCYFLFVLLTWPVMSIEHIEMFRWVIIFNLSEEQCEESTSGTRFGDGFFIYRGLCIVEWCLR